MKKLKRLPLWVVAAMFIWFINDLSATTIKGRVLSCPVCMAKVDAMVIVSTNNFGGQDRDFLTYAVGFNPIFIEPITCIRCFFSGYTDDFERKSSIPELVKENILSGKILRPISPITSISDYDQIPAWQRYDLIAQTYQLLNKDKNTLADQYLKASWTVRLSSDPLSVLDKKTNKKVLELIHETWDGEAAKRQNRAFYETALGREFAQKAKVLKGEQRKIAAYAAIHLLRSHGENNFAKQVLPLLKTVEAEDKYMKMQRSLKKSISREQFFQAKAVLLFEKAGEEPNNRSEMGSLWYLSGELNRRLGNWAKARHYFEKCEEMTGLPKWLAQYAKEQKELIPK